MFARRRWVGWLCSVVWLVPGALAGCADLDRRLLPPPSAQAATDRATPVPVVASQGDADMVMARAIAEHEMRKP